MNQTFQAPPLEEMSIEALIEALFEFPEMRTQEDIERIADLLVEAPYFKNHFNDLQERKEFIQAASPFFNYVYYAKGATICHQGDFPPNFGIILKGKALVFAPKMKEELDKEKSNALRMQCFERYKQYARQNRVFRQFRRLQTSHSSYCSQGSFSRPKTTSNIDHCNPSLLDLEEEYVDPIEEITKPKSSIIPLDIAKGDLSIDERFLLLSYGEGIKNYFKDGISTHKKIKELTKGDKIAETAFTINQPFEHTIIASEDLHVLSIKKECFQTLAAQRLPCFKRKRQFLSMVFPKLSYDSILQLSVYLEEKTFSSWEYIYKEGQDADALYIIKSGEIQLLKNPKEEKKEKTEEGSVILKDNAKSTSITKNKLIIGSVDIGGVFGEEEIIRNSKRKYSAKCNNSTAVLYIINREVNLEFYLNTILTYYPDVARAIKSMMYTRSNWRTEREKFSQRVATEIMQNQELAKSEVLNLPSEDIPSDFCKKFNLLLSKTSSNSTNPSLACEERVSRMTKRKVEINVKKIQKPPQQDSAAGGFTTACLTALENQKTRLWRRNQSQTVIFTNKTKCIKNAGSPKANFEKTPKVTPTSSPNKPENHLPKTFSPPVMTKGLTLRLSKSLSSSGQIEKIIEAANKENQGNQGRVSPVANSKINEVLQRHCSISSNNNQPYLDLVKRESTPTAAEYGKIPNNSWVANILSVNSQNSDTPKASSKCGKTARKLFFPEDNFTPKAMNSINSWAESCNQFSTPKHNSQGSVNSIHSDSISRQSSGHEDRVFAINRGGQEEPIFVRVKAQTPKASQTLVNPSQFRKFSKHHPSQIGLPARKISCQI